LLFFSLQNDDNNQRVFPLICRAYNKFIGKNPQVNPAYAEKLKDQSNFNPRKESKSSMENYEDRHTLPRIYRFHSYMKPEEE
jgi:hypothetical protein